ncbi:MAG: hypothetical protein ABL949_07935 [Fimbriimonadaceae bacterium]
MVASLEALLDGVIDYAGLFPPAGLSMLPALQEYLAHLEDDEQLLVNRFVCPTARLAELVETMKLINADFEFGVTAIGSGGGDVDTFAACCRADADAIKVFEDTCQARSWVEAYETKIPNAPLSSILKALRPIDQAEWFLEVPLNEKLSDVLSEIAVSEAASAKARTGGLEKAAFPSAAALAGFIKECMDLNLPFKLTAGLHHPIPCDDAETGGAMHGFLNVTTAAALIEDMDLNRAEVERLLLDRDPRNFSFDDDGIEWRGQTASLDSIGQARMLFAGFGSCSVAEPVEDLRHLGLW